jgi:hypothetical protein
MIIYTDQSKNHVLEGFKPSGLARYFPLHWPEKKIRSGWTCYCLNFFLFLATGKGAQY